MKHASLCVLSFNRKEVMEKSLKTLAANTRYPYELIILDDGSNRFTQEYLFKIVRAHACLLYTSPSPRDRQRSRMPSSA